MKYSLSPIQQGMYVSAVSSPNEGIDIEQITIEFKEKVNTNLLKKCWQEVVNNCELLRASITVDENANPQHDIKESIEVTMDLYDWRKRGAIENQELLQEFLLNDRIKGFNINSESLNRFSVVQLSDSHYYFIWTFHHIILDGRSFNLILNDVFSRYDNQSSNPNCSVPNFKDYISWLNDYSFQGYETFWKDYLNGVNNKTKLPQYHSNEMLSSTRYGEKHVFLGEKLSTQLDEFAIKNEVTLNTLLQGAWAILLHRHTGERDVVFANTKTTRSGSIKQATDCIGIFLATLPLRVKFDDQLTVLDLLNNLRKDWVSFRGYEHVSISDLAKYSDIDKSDSLFDSLVVFERFQFEDEIKKNNTHWDNRNVSLKECTNFPLALLGYGGEKLKLKLEFDNRRYSESFAVRILSQFTNILKEIVKGVENIQEIELLSEEEVKLLDTWNQTNVVYTQSSRNVYELFSERAKDTPRAVAYRDSVEQFTYNELHEKVDCFATHLQSLGVSYNTRVGINLDRDVCLIVSLLAIWKIGATYIPLDPSFPKDRLEFMVSDSKAKFILKNYKSDNSFVNQDAIIIDVQKSLFLESKGKYEEKSQAGEHVAYILYTSGSTGKPKGVEITSCAFSNFISSMAVKPGISKLDRLLAITTLSFDIAGLELFLPLVSGAELILANKEEAKDGRKLLHLIEELDPTIMQATPATWRMLIDSGLVENKNLKVLCGGEALSLDLANQLNCLVGQLWNMYGPTETTVWSTVKLIKPEARHIAVGGPIANTQLYVVDENLQNLPIGGVGELLIGGDSVALGYLNRPELNSKAFITFNGARVYRTGDLARFKEDGDLECLGRIDSQVKIRGFRIELGEIEDVLVQHPDISLSALIVDESEKDKRLVAFVEVSTENQKETLIHEAITLAKSKLPFYMVPALIIVKEHLPLTPNNKVDRKTLTKEKFVIEDKVVDKGFVAADTIDEILLEQIWQMILKKDAISVHDNFFEVGGDSLSAVMLLVKIEEAFKVNLPLSSLIEHNSIYSLAIHIREFSAGLLPISTELKKGVKGSKTIFCIPGAAGNAMALYNFSQEFNDDYKIYGLELNSSDEDIVKVDKLASLLYSEIKKIQPEGPYILIGLCFGSLLAIEVAKKFKKTGDELDLLMLLDPPKLNFQKSFRYYLGVCQIIFRKLMNDGPLAMIVPILKKAAKTQHRPNSVNSQSDSIIARFDRLRDDRIEESSKYIPKEYPDKATICFVKTGGGLDLLNCEESWNQIISSSNSDKEYVEGSHGDFFLRPHSRGLAELVKSRLK